MEIRFACKKVISPVTYCSLSVKAGTRDEDPKYSGLAHLTEHMLFKGTEKRSSRSINNLLEKEGGELNAYTTKEEIVLCSTVLIEDLPKAIDLLAELALTSIFPPKELEKELDIVYDEIISYKDSPAESIYDHFESLLFKGHSLEKAILGEKKTLRKIDSNILKEFLHKNFRPENMVFSVAGNIEEKKLARLIEKSMSKYCKCQVKAVLCAEEDNEDKTSQNPLESLQTGQQFRLELQKRNHQAHCIIGCSAYSFYDGWKRIALALITNILGGPASGSRLNMNLREKHGLVYNIEATYTPYSDTGIFSIYFGCDKSLVQKCRELVYKELERIAGVPLSESELKNAKKQFLGQLFISQDNSETQCLAMGKSLLVYNRIYPFEHSRKQIEEITSQQLVEVAKEILDKARLSELIYK
jgi:predicted Zn-dependent peptidase